MNTENSKKNEPRKLDLRFSPRLDFVSSSRNVALQKLSIYYTWKNIRKHYKNNELKIIAPIWKDKFKLPIGLSFVSDLQDYIEYIIKKHETLTRIPPIRVYVNIANNRLVFKIRDGYKLEFQRPETMKLCGSRACTKS